MKNIDGKKNQMTLRQTNRAISLLRRCFENHLSEALNLERVSAPVMVRSNSGLNDDLSGVEKPVSFFAKNCGVEVEIVQSLAKWKRVALLDYGFNTGEGLYTDMNAIRPDDSCDMVHSIYVDQWDWEKIINNDQRNLSFLKDTVKKITNAIVDTFFEIKEQGLTDLKTPLTREVFFVTSEELLLMYPNLSAKEREHKIVKNKKTVFIMQIGESLSNGQPHDSRSPDYDDFSLNGDLLFYHEALDFALEISSMGIRVNCDSLKKQLEQTGNLDRLKHKYHQDIISGILPLSIGGGIGQSRLCMLLLNKPHIGQVQSSIWSDKELERCRKQGIEVL